MGYLHIDNLYKNQEIFLFKECYALEKIHGSSANITYQDGKLVYFPGGCFKLDQFKALFNEEELLEKFKAITVQVPITVYGESYGGKCQGWSATYGPDHKFIAFDVMFGENWLDVPNAHDICTKIGIEFVHYVKIPTTLEAIDAEKNADSEQAIRNGMGPGRMREGVVLRPIKEYTKNNGSRVIVKHKRDEMRETLTTRPVDPTKAIAQREGQAVADEFVVQERLRHVLDKLPEAVGVEHTGAVIKAMLEDVKREAGDEVKWSKDAEKAITVKTAHMYKNLVKAKLNEMASKAAA